MGNYYREEYHDGYASWRNTRDVEGPLIGIELEVEGQDGYESILEAIPDTENSEERPLTEDDGSLSDENGVEIIFPPMDPRRLVQANSFFSSTLKALSKISLRESNIIGMHINVNTFGWSERKTMLFVALFHQLPRGVIENIGGRPLNGYCGQWQLPEFEGYLDTDEHAYAAEVKSGRGRVELRFPKSTTDIKRVRTILTFVGVAEKWAGRTKIPTEYLSGRDAARTVRQDFNKYLGSVRKTVAVKKILEVMKNGYT